MVAVHTTSLSILTTLLDIFESPHSEQIVAALRDECTTVLAKYNGQWDKNAVNELYRIDSCIRESMRVSGMGLMGMMREVRLSLINVLILLLTSYSQVAAKDGVDFGDGVHIPQGVKIVVAQKAIQTDPQWFPNSTEYDAFRFSRARENIATAAKEEGKQLDTKEVLEQKNQAVITTSDKFLAFGHGKHACPGRFFASQEMKLMLAHIVMRYDVRLKAPRRVRDLGPLIVPDDKAEFEVRLRS